MKFVFKFLFFVFFTTSGLYYNFLYAEALEEVYLIEVGKIDIGKVYWNLNIDENNYKTSVILEDRGFLSSLYSFDGSYESAGVFKKNYFRPNSYKQDWTTKKKTRKVEIFFENGIVKKMNLYPEEKELPRIKYIGTKKHVDPISSFLNIFFGNNQSKTIDGRRSYTMYLDNNYDEDGVGKILIKDYVNIWADHKRNDLGYINIAKKDSQNILSLPKKIIIKFKGIKFVLKKL